MHRTAVAVTQAVDVSRAELPFGCMLNALRLKDGFALRDFSARTGLPLTVIQQPLEQPLAKGLIERDLQSLLLPA